MPSEVIIPGFAVIVLLLVASIYFASMLTNAVSALADALRTYNDNLAKLNNKVKIVEAEAMIVGNGVLHVFLMVENQGYDPIYRMNECDLILEYTSLDAGVVPAKLRYGAEWWVESVIIAGDYTVSFDERRVIGGGEIGVIRAVFKAADLDPSRPFKVVFVSQYGSRDYKWVIIGA